MEIPVLPTGMPVQVEGNGTGTIRHFLTENGRTPQYCIKLDSGGEAEVNWYKVNPLDWPTPDWPEPWFTAAKLHRDKVVSGQGRRTAEFSEVGPAPDLMGAAQRHTGVVRMAATPSKGDIVCLCQHPLQNVRDRHDLAEVIEVRPGQLEPYVLKDLKTGAYAYANHKQFSATVEQDHTRVCALEVDPSRGEKPTFPRMHDVAPAYVETGHEDRLGPGAIVEDRKQYFWGFAIGDDVAVRGWGAGKVFEVHPNRKQKPVEVELANGKRIFVELEQMTKIKYGSVLPPLAEHLKRIEDKIDLLRNEIQSARGDW